MNGQHRGGYITSGLLQMFTNRDCISTVMSGRLYFDGHERQDVDYRKQFLVDISEYQRRMFSYVGDDLEITVRPDLRDGKKPIVLVTHDESCFSSNDGKKTIWMEEDRRPLRSKGQGRCIMV
jgi:hypothetical protein